MLNTKMPTSRQKIIELLGVEELTARELSQVLGIKEKEVIEHLPHIARTVAAQKRKLVIRPGRCLSCGYVFEDRQRFSKPGRCPRCKKSQLETPGFKITDS